MPEELLAFVEFCIKLDNSYSLSLYMQFDECLRSNSGPGCEYLDFILSPCKARLATAFEKFMDEQMRSIEEVKLDGKKRVVRL